MMGLVREEDFSLFILNLGHLSGNQRMMFCRQLDIPVQNLEE